VLSAEVSGLSVCRLSPNLSPRPANGSPFQPTPANSETPVSFSAFRDLCGKTSWATEGSRWTADGPKRRSGWGPPGTRASPIRGIPAGGAIAVANVERVVGLWLVSCDGSGEPRPVGDGEERWGAAFSPDGAYLAYTAVTAGVADVFVEALSGNQARWQVSTEGARPLLEISTCCLMGRSS
jgi:hypothetical protein